MFCIVFMSLHAGKYLIQKVVPQASGESSKVKVKVRVNIHGIFSVSSASLVEVQKSDETEEPMETEEVNDKEEQVHVSTLCSTIKWTPSVHLCSQNLPQVVSYLHICSVYTYTFFYCSMKAQNADRSGRSAESGRWSE